jgi:predicted MFS family arabinose efflux permease
MKEKLWNKHYILVLLVNTLNAFSFYMVATILSKYLVNIGTTVAMAGFIVGLFSLTSLCCRPLSGIMADRLSNVTLLKWSNIFMSVGLLGFIITTQIPLLIGFRIINGIGFALSGTSQISLATRYIPKDKMGEGIGYLGLGMVLGSAVAPGFGLAIADSFGMKITFLISAAFTLIAFLILCFYHEEKKQVTEKKKVSFSDIIAVKALPFTLVAGAFSFTNGIVASYLVLYADKIGVKGISIYFTVCAIVLFIARPFSGKLMDKKGIRVTVLPGLLLTALAMFMLGRSSTLILILITGAIRSLGQGAAQPSLQAGCISAVGKDRSGVATSTYYLGGDVCQGFGPMIGGVIIGSIAGVAGYTTLFNICGMLLLCALVFFFLITGKKQEV